MSLPPTSAAQTEKVALPARRAAPSARRAPQPGWTSLLPWAAAGVALLIGIGFGVLIMRHRHEGQQVVAAVNGVRINQDEFFTRLQAAAGQPVIHKMVEEELQIQFAAKKGVAPTNAEVEAKYAQINKDPRFLPMLAASGLTLDEYKRGLLVKLSQAKVLTKGITVTDAEVQNFYKLQSDPRSPQAQFYKPDVATFRVIATANKDPNVAKQVADHALQELNSGTPFDLVAAEFSMDPSKDNGGLLLPLQRGRSPLSQNPALENAVYNLKATQVYGPIFFNKGWWIFRCESIVRGQAVPFDTVKDEARLGAEIVKGSKLNGPAIRAEFQAFQQDSTKQAFWKQYQHAVTGR